MCHRDPPIYLGNGGYSQVQTDFEKPGASRGGREQGAN
jgi:hypothetical protein